MIFDVLFLICDVLLGACWRTALEGLCRQIKNQTSHIKRHKLVETVQKGRDSFFVNLF